MAPSISLTNSIVLNYISFQRWMNCKVIHSPPISIVHWGSNALLFRKDLDYCGLLSGSDTVSKRNKRQFSLLKLLHITQISKNHRSSNFPKLEVWFLSVTVTSIRLQFFFQLLVITALSRLVNFTIWFSTFSK